MLRLVAIALLATAAPGLLGAAEGPKCFATWTEAAPVVRKEALVAIEQVSTLAQQSLPGAQVIRTTLCEDAGRFIYRLLVREPQGQLRTVNVDARKPFEN